jgi:hypothetical protein
MPIPSLRCCIGGWRTYRRELLKNKRAEYGRAILPTVSAKLEPYMERDLVSVI